MSLFDYSMVIHHLVVVKALHDVQLTACIGCIEFCFQCIPELFAVFYVHIHITQTSIKNTQNTATNDSSIFLELILSFLRLSSSRRTITNFPHTHGLEPELALDLLSFKPHTTSEFFRFHCISITSHS